MGVFSITHSGVGGDDAKLRIDFVANDFSERPDVDVG